MCVSGGLTIETGKKISYGAVRNNKKLSINDRSDQEATLADGRYSFMMFVICNDATF